MTISNANLSDFITNFFSLHKCDISYKDEGVIDVQLTEVMDKKLMNRPFYWQYIKSTGQTGKPMNLTFITNPDKKDQAGEWIHFGSPRLQQIIGHLKATSRFTRLFQQLDVTTQTPLFPWLVINIKIKYTGKLTKEDIYSIGINLVNGLMKVNMMKLLQDENLKLHITDYCYPISPIIKIPSAYKRIETILDQYIGNQSHDWAIDSLYELEKERELIHYFYQNDAEDDQLNKELEEVTLRYTPTITYEVLNGGLLYLDQDFNKEEE